MHLKSYCDYLKNVKLILLLYIFITFFVIGELACSMLAIWRSGSLFPFFNQSKPRVFVRLCGGHVFVGL